MATANEPPQDLAPMAQRSLALPALVSAERPLTLQLPSGAHVPLHSASTLAGGSLDVPADVDAAGWWDGGARLGDPFGAMILAGHVDSATEGLGPFAELLTIQSGDRFTVRSRHLRQAFEVTSVAVIAEASLRGFEAGSTSQRVQLVLITCSGPFDPVSGYQNRTIVTAGAASPPRNRRTSG